ETSEMCTQILFGEHYTILDANKKWCKIKLAFDGYEGWIDLKMVNEIDERRFEKIQNQVSIVTTDPFNIVQPEKNYINFLIVAGSSLPFYKPANNSFRIGEEHYLLQGDKVVPNKKNVRKFLIENALKYFNSPYLWGGRSPFGIDCSGFTQILYKMIGTVLPRDAHQQAHLGENFSFVEEALPGDLAFFDNEDGKIVHVGMIWEKNKIIHSSGKVRIDNVDQFGIFNIDTRRYSHQLRLMKRILPESE
ncbi:MAG: C40 family peptidase, partial [Marinilabiliales bacterium]|nr:C40 family peptidase [Marinilabiliales bacterium]